MHEILVQHVEYRLLVLVLDQVSRIRTSFDVPRGARFNLRITSCRFGSAAACSSCNAEGWAAPARLLDGAVETARIWPEVVDQRDQEIALAILVETLPDGEDFARPSDAGGFPTPRDEIAGESGDCDASLAEFLIGLLAVAIGPNDNDDWHELYERPPTAEALATALQPLADMLVLDGDGPRFFQDRDQLDRRPTPSRSAVIDAPRARRSSDNADHSVEAEQVLRGCFAGGAAITLLTLQTSAPAGGAGHRTSLRGRGPLTTLVVTPREGRSGADAMAAGCG